jgi:hypothetical protein
VFNNKHNSSILYPIAFSRILTNVQNAYAKYAAQLPNLDLHPLQVLDTLDTLAQKLIIRKNDVTADSGTRLLQILLRMHLSPKKMLLKHRFNRDAFDIAVQQIQTRFYDSLAHPSEMVGVMAAQSYWRADDAADAQHLPHERAQRGLQVGAWRSSLAGAAEHHQKHEDTDHEHLSVATRPRGIQ